MTFHVRLVSLPDRTNDLVEALAADVGRSHPARVIQSPPSGCILCCMGVSGSTTLIATGVIVRCAASWQPEDSDLAQQACGTGRRA